MSHDAPTVSARFVNGSTTTHAGSATIHPDGAAMLKNAHDAVTIRYGATKVQAGSATTASRSPTNVNDLAVFMWQVIRDVSNTTIHPDSSRTLKNGHDSTHGAAKNEPDPATVALRFRPRPQSTTIHHDSPRMF